MRTTRPVGFTLLELMIVVAVIAILAAIAVPNYLEQVRKGKRAEAVQAIGDMQLRQERWRADNSSYANTTAATEALGNLFGGVAAVTNYNAGLKYYNISITGNNATDYVITATRKGDLANDPKCGNFTLTRDIVAPATVASTVKGVSAGNVAYCWRE